MLLFVGGVSMGQPFEKSRSLSKSFKVNEDTEVQISNKYGNIQLIPWENDSIKFDIDFSVVANKESKLNNIYDYIDFDFNNSQHFIDVQTSFAGKGTFWSDVKDLAGTVFAGGTKTQINYKIYLPAYLSIKIDNKYGDVFTSDHDGPISIILSNGDLKSHSFNGKTSLNLKFTSANIKYIKDGNIDISYYSDLQLDEAEDLIITSRSSKLYIDKSNNLEINSNRDKYYLDSVNELNATNAFTYLEIKNLGEKIKANTNYGDIIIKSLNRTVSTMIIDIESTDVRISKEADQSIRLKVKYNEKAGLYFPSELKNKETLKVDGDKKLVITKGLLGEKNENTIILNSTNLSGELRINNK